MEPGFDTCSASCPYSFNIFQPRNYCDPTRFTKTNRFGDCHDPSVCTTTDPCVLCTKNYP